MSRANEGEWVRLIQSRKRVGSVRGAHGPRGGAGTFASTPESD